LFERDCYFLLTPAARAMFYHHGDSISMQLSITSQCDARVMRTRHCRLDNDVLLERCARCRSSLGCSLFLSHSLSLSLSLACAIVTILLRDDMISRFKMAADTTNPPTRHHIRATLCIHSLFHRLSLATRRSTTNSVSVLDSRMHCIVLAPSIVSLRSVTVN